MSLDQGRLRKVRKDIIADTLRLNSGNVEGGSGGGDETFTTITMLTSGADPSHNIPGPGNYIIEKILTPPDSGSSTGIFDFTPQEGDIVKLVYKDNTGGAPGVLFIGLSLYRPGDTGAPPVTTLNLSNAGGVAIVQYFGSSWYPLNGNFTATM